ncbi:hypothetical protein EV122DRAFT_256684 [Schizophyllum commune]
MAHAPADPPGNHIASSMRDVGFRYTRCRPSTSATTTRTTLGTPDDIQTTPSHGRRSPPSPSVPFPSPFLLILAGQWLARRHSAFNVLPATPVVVPNHAAAIFAFDAGLLDDASDASHVAQLDALNALDSPLAPLLSRASNIGGSPLDDVAEAFDVALSDALNSALIDTLALCVAALIERRWCAFLSAFASVADSFPRRPLTSRLNASCSRAEDSDVDIPLRAGLVEGEGASVKGGRRTPAKSDRASCVVPQDPS